MSMFIFPGLMVFMLGEISYPIFKKATGKGTPMDFQSSMIVFLDQQLLWYKS